MTLRNSPFSVRIFCSSVLLTLGIAYTLALVYLYAQEVRPHRLQGHGLVQGIANTYHGIPGETQLLASLRGTMATTVTPEEFADIEAWVLAGAPEATYGEKVGPIIENNCASCHGEGGYFPLLTSFEDVEPLTQPDAGVDVKRLARMTHVHVLAIPLVFFMLGSFFVRTRYPEKLKAVLVALPFAAVVWDIAHWWITRMEPSAAAGVVMGGALMSLGFASQWFLTAWDTWAPLRGPRSR